MLDWLDFDIDWSKVRRPPNLARRRQSLDQLGDLQLLFVDDCLRTPLHGLNARNYALPQLLLALFLLQLLLLLLLCIQRREQLHQTFPLLLRGLALRLEDPLMLLHCKTHLQRRRIQPRQDERHEPAGRLAWGHQEEGEAGDEEGDEGPAREEHDDLTWLGVCVL